MRRDDGEHNGQAKTDADDVAFRLAASRPGPLSQTVTSTSPPATRAEISMTLPGGVYLAAFSSRLLNTRCISIASSSSTGRSPGRSMRTLWPPRTAARARSAAPTASMASAQPVATPATGNCAGFLRQAKEVNA